MALQALGHCQGYRFAWPFGVGGKEGEENSLSILPVGLTEPPDCQGCWVAVVPPGKGCPDAIGEAGM